MDAVFIAILALAVPPPHVNTSATPSTRLFVRTVPTGAALTLDGTRIGESDGLFPVPAGSYQLGVQLDGHAPETREIQVRQGRITRLEIRLRKQSQVAPGQDPQLDIAVKPIPETAVSKTAGSASGSGSDRSAAAATVISRGSFSDATRQAMLTVLRQHPGETRWSGRDGNLLFGIAVKPLPQGEVHQRAVPAMLELVQMLAVHEVLKAKTLLDRYAAAGLTDATTLRQAVEAAAGQLQVTGKAKGVVFQAAARSGFAVAYIVAQQADLSAYLLQPTELEKCVPPTAMSCIVSRGI